jgi:hypothetical protein
MMKCKRTRYHNTGGVLSYAAAASYSVHCRQFLDRNCQTFINDLFARCQARMSVEGGSVRRGKLYRILYVLFEEMRPLSVPWVWIRVSADPPVGIIQYVFTRIN